MVELVYLDNDSGSTEVSLTIGNMLKANQSIEILYLGTNDLGNEALSHVVEGVLYHPMLTMLDLNSNPFTDDQSICKLLSANTPLKEIDLTDSKIPERGFLNIKSAMRDNTNLTTFDVYFHFPPINCLQDIQTICEYNEHGMNNGMRV